MGSRIICLGNPDIPSDSYAHDVLKALKERGYETLSCRSVDEFMELVDEYGKEEHFILIDTVKGLETVRRIDPDEFTNAPSTSLHDFDIGYLLQLLESLGESPEYTIIGIPREKLTKESMGRVVRLIENS